MPTQSKRPKFTPEERARFAAMTDDQIREAAIADPDAQPVTPDKLKRAVAARRLRLAHQQRDAKRSLKTQALL